MIRSPHSHLPVAADTHPGMTGKNNEDRYAVSAYRLKSKRSTAALLAVLSDGIGGHRAGEVAAEITVQTISQHVSRSEGGDPTRILQQAIQDASEKIRAQAVSDPEREGMGATCACAWIIGRRLYAATVGDSRLYLMRGDTIRQLSTDHTWVQEAIEGGLLQPEQIRGHPNAHVIRRYLGSPTPPQVDIRLRLSSRESDTQAEANQGFALLPGDRLLLCTDGLTDLVENEEIQAAYQDYPLEQATQLLLDLANQRGGTDNITLIAIDVPERAVPGVLPGGTRRAPAARSCLWIVLLGLLAGGLLLGGLWYFGLLGGLPIVGPAGSATPDPAAATQAPPFPSATQIPALPTATTGPEVFGTPLTTQPAGAIPPPSGPTLTPWPTNTPGPTAASSPTRTPTPLP